jgi:hypothetical protein
MTMHLRVRGTAVIFTLGIWAAALLLAGSGPAAAEAAAPPDSPGAPGASGAPNAAPNALLSTLVADQAAGGGTGGESGWFATVDRTQAEQPHWMTPLVTVTPRLEEEVRYDQVWQARPGGANFTNYDNGKGLELIPAEIIELIVNAPAYEELTPAKGNSKYGWADESLLLKVRGLSANEESGNYIVTGFLGLSLPTGSTTFTQNFTVWTPTIAAGKGWGTRTNGVDGQSTFGAAIPGGNETKLGIPMTWNTAFQLHVFEEHIWPEVELNYTHFHDGPNDGKDMLMYTVGVIAGRFPIAGRVRLAIGGGYEQAVSAFRTFNHAWIFTLRTPF